MKTAPSLLCKDCKFCGANNPARMPPARVGQPVIPQPGSSGRCYHLSALKCFDPVTGEKLWDRFNSSAHYQRSFSGWLARVFGKCGRKARWFVPATAKK